MDYAGAIEHLHELGLELAPPKDSSTPRRKFDLEHMRRLCQALGNPQDQVPSVLIAGTNGKGSTAATLASILTQAGYRAGLYTSPHLVRENERIQISHPVMPTEYGASVSAGAAPGADGDLALGEIPDETFARLYSRVEDAASLLTGSGDLPHAPSFFERLTAIAFLFFAERQAEIMVLEVGLGGRLDATNVVQPLLSVITDIALDHQEYLGSTLTEITREKCGILRRNGVLITLPQHPEANHAIGLAATALDAIAVDAARYVPDRERLAPKTEELQSSASSADGERGAVDPAPRNHYLLHLKDGSTLQVDSPLWGHHQQRNLALAIAAAMELRTWRPTGSQAVWKMPYAIPNSAIEQGICHTKWPGRLEFVAPDLLLDVAHNPAGAWTLRYALSALPPERPRTLIFSCLRDKSLSEMSRILFPLFDSSPDGDPERRMDHIILAPIANPRAADVRDLLAAAEELGAPAHAAPHLAGALAQARQITPPGGLIVATGSVYLVGEVRQLATTAAHDHTESTAGANQ